MEYAFTSVIKAVLSKHFGENFNDIFRHSSLIQYLNKKTKSANKGSKARGSFANIYALYVLIEDYVLNGYHEIGDYSDYEGAVYKKIFARQRELPFGAKLQNHALNNRLNSEFENWFPTLGLVPIIRLAESERYWINKNLLEITIGEIKFNIANSVLEIIEEYTSAKKESFNAFIQACQNLQNIDADEAGLVKDFIIGQLAPNVDARLFEIVSYSILKFNYYDQKIFWGYKLEIDSLKEENLVLFKTGRTNANDGGIDFVMKPLGRFFQVTETLDFRKYFLDIAKLQKYPITFVVKTEESLESLRDRIYQDALRSYPSKTVVEKYMSCIEELINIPTLRAIFSEVVKANHLNDVLQEVINQSKVEFNFGDSEEDSIE